MRGNVAFEKVKPNELFIFFKKKRIIIDECYYVNGKILEYKIHAWRKRENVSFFSITFV